MAFGREGRGKERGGSDRCSASFAKWNVSFIAPSRGVRVSDPYFIIFCCVGSAPHSRTHSNANRTKPSRDVVTLTPERNPKSVVLPNETTVKGDWNGELHAVAGPASFTLDSITCLLLGLARVSAAFRLARAAFRRSLGGGK